MKSPGQLWMWGLFLLSQHPFPGRLGGTWGTFPVAGWVSQGADHDFTTAQAVGGVGVAQVALPEDVLRVDNLPGSSQAPSRPPCWADPGKKGVGCCAECRFTSLVLPVARPA